MQSLVQKLRTGKNILTGLALAATIATTTLAAEPIKSLRISPNEYGEWNTSTSIELVEANMKGKEIGRFNVPIYLMGEKNEATKSIIIAYSVIPFEKLAAENTHEIATPETRFYFLAPAGVEIEIEQGEKYNMRGKIITSAHKKVQPASIERAVFKAAELGIEYLRIKDPIENLSDSIDPTGTLGDKISIHGFLKKLLVDNPEQKNQARALRNFSGEMELQEVKLETNDRESRFPEMGKNVRLKINPGTYTGAKIPVGIDQVVTIGNASSQPRDINQVNKRGQLEILAEFEFDNPNANKTETPSSGRYIALLTKEIGQAELKSDEESAEHIARAVRETSGNYEEKEIKRKELQLERDQAKTEIQYFILDTKKQEIFGLSEKPVKCTRNQHGNYILTNETVQMEIEISEKKARLIFQKRDEGKSIINLVPIKNLEDVLQIELSQDVGKRTIQESDLKGISLTFKYPDLIKEPENIIAVTKCKKNKINLSLGSMIYIDVKKIKPQSIDEMARFMERRDADWGGLEKLKCPSGGNYIIDQTSNLNQYTVTCTIPAHQNITN